MGIPAFPLLMDAYSIYAPIYMVEDLKINYCFHLVYLII